MLHSVAMADQMKTEDAIVISGMSGKVANADNLAEYKRQIYNKMDMISRCKHFPRISDAPERYGSIPTIDKFDNGFFSIHERHVNVMEPSSRLLLEIACEAIWDAGISLEELKGAKASMHIAVCFTAIEPATELGIPEREQLLGATRLCLIDRLCHFLEIDGPKFAVDTACSSSLYGLECAVNELKSGTVNYAIVAGHSLTLDPTITSQFFRLGVLSHDGTCKTFDRNADGYVRSDSVQVLILQRAGDARRNYAEVMKVLSNCDGYKEHGINFPSSEVQGKLFEEFYSNYKISPQLIGFMEAHGTGTKVGDPEELVAIENFFCKNRKDPLLIGSVKSNLGHAEGASGINSLIKCCWILESNKIPPNIHYRNANPAIPGLTNGKLHVVTDVMELPEDKPYVASSNFGFGGANAHVLLRRLPYKRAQSSYTQDIDTRLVCLSGRTYESVMSLYNGLKSGPFDPDFIALLNAALGRKTAMLDCRGYCVANKDGISPIEILELRKEVAQLKCFFPSSGIAGLATSVIKFKCFQEHLEKVKTIFSKHKIQNNLFLNNNNLTESNTEDLIETIVIQTGIVELLKTIKLDVSTYMGSGIGELTAAFSDGVLSLEQILLIAYRITKLQQRMQPKLNASIISTEIQDICTLNQRPTKWQLQKNTTVHENLAQYIGERLFIPHIPNIDNKENVLIVGGNAAQSENVISLCGSKAENDFLQVIGRLHLLAYDIDVNQLYSIEWPVKAQTPMISPLVKWQHKKSWKSVTDYDSLEIKCSVITSDGIADWQGIYGHNIDGRLLFPATGYLRLAWKCFSNAKQFPLKFENITFHRACTMAIGGPRLKLTVQIQPGTGNFEIRENNSIVVTGTIKKIENFDSEWMYLPPLPVPKEENIMNKRDIYKELGLRGYYYQGCFKEVQNCDINATVAQIKWTEWCPFLDNILQVKILEADTRSLCVPIKIRQVIIHPEKHLDIIYMSGDIENCVIPVYNYKELNVIRCGYVEIRGLEAASIARRKNPNPVLEVNRFVPYVAEMKLEEATRVMVQIALENSYITKLKIIEEFYDVPSPMEPMLPFIQQALDDQPLIQSELVIYAKTDLKIPGIPSINKPPTLDNGNFIAIGYNLSQNEELRNALLSSLKNNGYLLSREDLQNENVASNLTIICEYTTPTEKVVLLRPLSKIYIPKPIHISADNFDWLESLKEARINKENQLLYSENECNNGLMGLSNCLFRETSKEKVITVLIDDKNAPKFDINDDFYRTQLQKDISVNVLKRGAWGSYRHLLVNANAAVESVHSYAHSTIRGDLSSLTWMQGNLSIPENLNSKNGELLHIYYSALNFKDVMLASGRLILDSVIRERLLQNPSLGFECAGRRENGQRVMAIHHLSGMISNIIRANENSIWPIPNHWTLAEAATVPCVYITNIYGLVNRAQIQEGDSILIHSATGGIGLSAINIAMYYKCKIFLTAGTEEKRKYILNNYPTIPAEHVGNSRDVSFYEMIRKYTNGEGVKIILNSLADEKLQASVKCLAFGGRFVEIGKFDCSQDSPLQIELAERDAEYHGVMVDMILFNPGRIMEKLMKQLADGIANGYVKPIPHVSFNRDELEPAFRHMVTGKHIGKVVVTIREEEVEKQVIPQILPCYAQPKLYCHPKRTYIILGGLGGFGLELADFLILRGARNIVLVSRRGITSGYQQYRIKIWRSYNCEIKISTEDCTTREGCVTLLEEAQKMGEVEGIFNLAVVLRDAIFENQTEETFLESYKPKAQCTIYLDELSREMCPKLQHFVVFSSVSCGRGNAGQTNYGYSNSVMERVCENRRNSGLPGKAIQWGVVGDVGIVADYRELNIDVVIGGTMLQRIANCLEVLDVLLTCEDSIVSSMVVAEKKGGATDDDPISVVCKVLQIKNIKTVSPNSTFPELGMDSMMAVEIKQTLERDFDLFLSPQELRNLTFARLAELANRDEGQSNNEASSRNVNAYQFMRFVPEEDKCNIPIVTMKTTKSPTCLYLMPGVEGMATIFEPLVTNLNMNVKCLQFCYDNTENTIEGLVQQKYQLLKKELNPNQAFLIAAHSISVTVALETVSLLERDGFVGTLLMLDGSPTVNKTSLTSLLGTQSDESIQTALVLNISSLLLPVSALGDLNIALSKADSFKQKCQIAINFLPNKSGRSDEFLFQMLTNTYCRVKAELTHEFKPRVYKSKLVLCKATISYLAGLPIDFGLRKIVGEELEIKEFEGDHIDFLGDHELSQFIENISNSSK